jgi:hypothetical protein
MDGFNPGVADTSAPALSALLTAYAAVPLSASLAPAAWPPSPTVWTEGANSTRGPVSTRVSTRAAATGVVPAPTTGSVVLQHPFVDGIFYKDTGVQQVRVSAVVRMQVVARSLLAQRCRRCAGRCGTRRRPWQRLPSMHRAATSTRWTASNNCADPLLYPRVCMVFFLWMAYSNSARAEVEEVSSSLSSTGTRCLAPQLSASGHREDVSVGLRRN